MKNRSRTIAKEYLKKQFQVMKKYGSAPKLDKQQYKKLLDDTEKSFVSLKATTA